MPLPITCTRKPSCPARSTTVAHAEPHERRHRNLLASSTITTEPFCAAADAGVAAVYQRRARRLVRTAGNSFAGNNHQRLALFGCADRRASLQTPRHILLLRRRWRAQRIVRRKIVHIREISVRCQRRAPMEPHPASFRVATTASPASLRLSCGTPRYSSTCCATSRKHRRTRQRTIVVRLPSAYQ